MLDNPTIVSHHHSVHLNEGYGLLMTISSAAIIYNLVKVFFFPSSIEDLVFLSSS